MVAGSCPREALVRRPSRVGDLRPRSDLRPTAARPEPAVVRHVRPSLRSAPARRPQTFDKYRAQTESLTTSSVSKVSDQLLSALSSVPLMRPRSITHMSGNLLEDVA